MTNNSLSKIPYWDGKAESVGVYLRDMLDPVLMANCPTKSEFVVIDITKPTNMPLVELYKAQEAVCYYCIREGQKSWDCSVGEDKE
jgi:hypothetical protein